MSILHLMRYFVKCTVTDLTFNTQQVVHCPPSAWIHFLTCVTREHVTLRSTATLSMFLTVLRIHCRSSSLVLPCVHTENSL